MLLLSLLSLSWSLHDIVEEHQDVANYVYDHAKTRLELQAASLRLLTPADVEANINEAIDAGDMVLARSYRAVADDLGYWVTAETEARFQDEASLGNTLWRNTRKGAEGFLYGHGPSMTHLAGALASDLTLYGDARDVTIQTRNYALGEEVDELIFALSGVGLALTAGTYVTYGATAPAKFWVSALKFAKSTGALTDRFAAFVKRTMAAALPFDRVTRNLVDVPYWQRVRGLRPAALQDDIAVAIGKSINPREMATLERVVGDLETINKATDSPETVMRTLKLVDTPEDLASLRQISETAGAKTAAYADGFGKSIFDKVKYTLKVTTKLYLKYAWAIFSLVAGLTSAFFIFGAKRLALLTLR
ncbi:MAG: hypothetical protein AAFY56_19710 [Pseudomonadota bacterium]